MPSHRQSRVIDHSAERLFDIVADVERYPEFLPLMRRATIIARDETGYLTEQTLVLGLMSQRFRSRTILERPQRIIVISSDPPFRHFEVKWEFTPLGPTRCQVDFSLDCEAGSLLLIPFVQMVVVPLGATMVAAFEGRANALAASTITASGTGKSH